MKVILLQDVAKIGKKGDIAEVPNGYAMNSLIPQGKVTPATGSAVRMAEGKAAAAAADAADTAAAFTTTIKTLQSSPITIPTNANAQGHLFKAISAEAIAAAATQSGATIDAKAIHIAEPIKSVGDHTITLRHGDTSADVIITVTAA